MLSKNKNSNRLEEVKTEQDLQENNELMIMKLHNEVKSLEGQIVRYEAERVENEKKDILKRLFDDGIIDEDGNMCN